MSNEFGWIDTLALCLYFILVFVFGIWASNMIKDASFLNYFDLYICYNMGSRLGIYGSFYPETTI